MAKKRLYVPVDEHELSIIKAIAKRLDRSDAWVASHLIIDGINYNLITDNLLNPSADPIEKFKLNHP